MYPDVAKSEQQIPNHMGKQMVFASEISELDCYNMFFTCKTNMLQHMPGSQGPGGPANSFKEAEIA
jgi:hypothetical protein